MLRPDFLLPLLRLGSHLLCFHFFFRLVGLFKPPEELSALVVMELLYYYALAHQDSFDVRWIRNGTVSDSLVAPMAAKLQEDYGLKVMGGCRVGNIALEPLDTKLHVSSVEYTDSSGNTKVIEDIDGIVLALGCKGMESVVRSSPDLARLPVFGNAASLRGIDVISVRLWLDKVVNTRTPANVFSRFEALRGAGGTFFMLDQLQENNPDLWGDSGPAQGEERGSVVACDFYNAGGLINLEDGDIVRILMEDLLPRYDLLYCVISSSSPFAMPNTSLPFHRISVLFQSLRMLNLWILGSANTPEQ